MPPFEMQHQEFEPPEELRDAIKCFWYNSRDSDGQQSSFEVIPDGYAEIIFYFGSVSTLLHNGNLQVLPSPFMMGLLNEPVHFYTKARLEIIGIRCFPWTVFDLLGLPSGKEGVQTFEHPIAQLQAALAKCIHAQQIAEALTLVEQYFLTTRSAITTNSMLAKAGIAMREANGTIAVSQVAAAAHATVRTLERKFKQSSGYTVKDVTSLMRFEQVRNHLWHHPNVNIASLAHEIGYTDQAHLSREFKRYSGSTPAAFARKAKQHTTGNELITFV